MTNDPGRAGDPTNLRNFLWKLEPSLLSHLSIEAMKQYAQGKTRLKEVESVSQHLRHCGMCRSRYAAVITSPEILRFLLREDVAGPSPKNPGDTEQ
ncbi:MAG: hypothetical protein V4671_25065 [Armatimonadota bacterium]